MPILEPTGQMTHCGGEGLHSIAEGIARTPARTSRPAGSGWDRLQANLDRLAANGARLLPRSVWHLVVRALRSRDGDQCCFGQWCAIGKPLCFIGWQPHQEAITIEHRVPWRVCRSHRLEHMALAHRLCNEIDGNMRNRYLVRERRLLRNNGHPFGKLAYMRAWPALTYADELEFE